VRASGDGRCERSGGDRPETVTLRIARIVSKVLREASEGAGTAGRRNLSVFAISHSHVNYTARCTQGGARCGTMSGLRSLPVSAAFGACSKQNCAA
jgi:hypothetical protein